MTNPDAIKAIAELRKQQLDVSAQEQGQHTDNLFYAAKHAKNALIALEKARNYGEALRMLDPEHAEEYPDPALSSATVHPLVAALHGLAERYAAIEIPPARNGAKVEISFHGMDLSTARQLAAAYAGNADVSEHTGSLCTWLVVKEETSETEVELTVYADLEPIPAAEPKPEVEPEADPAPGALEERQALEEAYPFTPQGLAAAAFAASAAEDVDPLAETAPHPIRPRPSREDAPIQVGDLVRVHGADDAVRADFPAEFEGMKGTVHAVDEHAFHPERGACADDDPPIDVMLDCDEEPQCFCVDEVTVLVRIEDAERAHAADELAGQLT